MFTEATRIGSKLRSRCCQLPNYVREPVMIALRAPASASVKARAGIPMQRSYWKPSLAGGQTATIFLAENGYESPQLPKTLIPGAPSDSRQLSARAYSGTGICFGFVGPHLEGQIIGMFLEKQPKFSQSQPPILHGGLDSQSPPR